MSSDLLGGLYNSPKCEQHPILLMHAAPGGIEKEGYN
jgi:hypothetical protein